MFNWWASYRHQLCNCQLKENIPTAFSLNYRSHPRQRNQNTSSDPISIATDDCMIHMTRYVPCTLWAIYSCDMHSVRKNMSWIVTNSVWLPMKISHLYYDFRLLTLYSAIIYLSWLIQSSRLPFFLPALNHFHLLCLFAKFSAVQNGVFSSKLHKVNMCFFTYAYTT